MCSQSDDPSMHDDLDAESRKPGSTMTITKAQYGALVAAARPSDEVTGLDELHAWLCKTARYSPTGAWGTEVRARLAALANTKEPDGG